MCLTKTPTLNACPPDGSTGPRVAVPARKTPRPAERSADAGSKRRWTATPVKQPSRTTFIALGRVQTLLQGLGGYTRGCADTPPFWKLHTFEDQNLLQGWHPPIHLRTSSPRRGRRLHWSLQTKITKGYWLKAVEKYKRTATCVAIFPVLGRSERR